MRNLILIQICQSDVTFKPTFDHFLKFCILADFGHDHKVDQVEIDHMGTPGLSYQLSLIEICQLLLQSVQWFVVI